MTVVSYQRKSIFGEIINGEMNLNQAGKIVEQTWRNIPMHFPNTSCEIFVVMPNHIDGIIDIINDEIVGARHASPLQSNRLKPQSQRINGVKPQSIGAIIDSFKPEVTKRVHALGLMDQKMIYGEILRTTHLG